MGISNESDPPALLGSQQQFAVSTAQLPKSLDRTCTPTTQQIQWQENDDIEDQTISLYNVIRDLLPDKDADGIAYVHACFPLASKSTGAIMRNCPACYINGAHCGYHAVPDHHNDDLLEVQYKQLSYVEMKRAADAALDTIMQGEDEDHFKRILVLQRYFGWAFQAVLKRLKSLDKVVATGWEGRS